VYIVRRSWFRLIAADGSEISHLSPGDPGLTPFPAPMPPVAATADAFRTIISRTPADRFGGIAASATRPDAPRSAGGGTGIFGKDPRR